MPKSAVKLKPVLIQMTPELYKYITEKKKLKMKQDHRHTLSMNAYLNEELSKHFIGNCKDTK